MSAFATLAAAERRLYLDQVATRLGVVHGGGPADGHRVLTMVRFQADADFNQGIGTAGPGERQPWGHLGMTRKKRPKSSYDGAIRTFAVPSCS